MIHNYLVVAIRNSLHHLSYSIINVLGLALGLACALLIFLIVSHHLSYDTQYADRDRLYRIVTEHHGEQVSYSFGVPAALGKAIREDLTYTEKVARIATLYQVIISVAEGGETKRFEQPTIACAENDFFDIISRPLVNGGKPYDVLVNPNDAVITQSVARKLFGDDDPINRVFTVNNTAEFRVAGVINDIPDNTDLRQEVFVSYDGLKFLDEYLASGSWSGVSSQMQCYAKLKPGVDITEMEEAMFGFVKKFRPNSRNVHHYKLQPLSEVHFDPKYGAGTDMQTIAALASIGLLLVVTACVNFVNIATARATGRAKEIGIRKSLGGLRSQIFRQFIAETFVITVIAALLAVGVVFALIPAFNFWFESRISLDLLGTWERAVFIPALVLLVTLAAGFYPGMILAGFQAAQALKGKLSQLQPAGLNLRRTLIIAQFAISQILIIGLIVVAYQVRYSLTTDVGFNHEAVIMIPIGETGEKAETLKSEFKQLAGVESVALCFSAPSSLSAWEAGVTLPNRDESENFTMTARMADEDYLGLFDIELAAGRNLTASDTLREFLVNEMFAERTGLSNEELLGQTITINEWKLPIVGIVKNFHTSSFHEDISPVFMGTEPTMYNTYAVRINMSRSSELIPALEKKWLEMFPNQIYSSAFLDDEMAGFYHQEENMLKMVQVFSLVSIVIGCMGLFGMVSFMAIQRTKEIGIRKVLGGSVGHILWLFSREFMSLIVLAFAIAGPTGWFIMNNWLQDYEFHITIDAWIFVVAIAASFVIALVTVGYRSLVAATANPVDSLRTE